MYYIEDELWCCAECTLWLVNRDVSGPRADAIKLGAEHLGPVLPHFDPSSEGIQASALLTCECCGRRAWAEYYRFCTLAAVAS